MAVVTLTRQAVSLQGFELTGPDAMLTAAKALGNLGYTTRLNCKASTWTFNLDRINGPSQTAAVGDWVVLENGTTAFIVTATEFASLYASG